MSLSASAQAGGRILLEGGRAGQGHKQAFAATRRAPRRQACHSCRAETEVSRRESVRLLTSSAAAALASAALPRVALAAAKAPSGYTSIKDAQDGYSFLTPFGWQEVAVKGQDVVYKDIIEPLESVSVSLTPTDKGVIEDYGSPLEIAVTLSNNVLTPQNQEVKVLNAGERTTDGRKYVEFEFASKASNYIRHALASVTIANGKLYTMTTGANEFRWDKMKDRLKTVLDSFEVVERY